MRSHLLEGKVRHRRARPFTYELEHDVLYFALDLDELDEVARKTRLVSRNRRNVVALWDRDHLPIPATDLRADFLAHLRAEGLAPDGWSVMLVTNLRVLGYAFNPASFFLCRDERGILRVVVVEVHNTFGERHLYTLQRNGDAGPFIEVHGQYSVHVRDERPGLRVAIAERQDGSHLLSTSLVLRRHRLDDRMVVRLLLRHPLVPHKTIALIHWHALRLRLRGARFFRHAKPEVAR